MGRSNAERYEEAERELEAIAVRETEQEVFDDALGLAPDDNAGPGEEEWTEGWDGEPLSDEELLHQATDGFDENGNDRPLEMRREQELERDNEQLRQEREELAQRIDTLENGEERQAARASQLRDEFFNRYGFLPTDDSRADRFFNDLASQQQQVASVHQDRINRSFEDVREEHGADFDTAFRSMTSMDPNNPTARALIQDVVNAPNPGERLMQLHHNGVHGGLSRNGMNPALGLAGARVRPSGGGGGRRMPSSSDLADADGGFGHSAIEQSIADSVWD
jgi:hypothetical protein